MPRKYNGRCEECRNVQKIRRKILQGSYKDAIDPKYKIVITYERCSYDYDAYYDAYYSDVCVSVNYFTIKYPLIQELSGRQEISMNDPLLNKYYSIEPDRYPYPLDNGCCVNETEYSIESFHLQKILTKACDYNY